MRAYIIKSVNKNNGGFKMNTDMKKIALIGTGMVGMSFAYAAMNQSLCDELVLIDVDKDRAEGEAMDLNHGLAFSGGNMKISAGDYATAADADIAVVCAGVPQKEGEDRIALLSRNASVVAGVTEQLLEAGFGGIFLIATNPVDVMSRVVHRISQFPDQRVMGTGTTLDTARLRYLLGAYFGLDPRNVHAYVIGEHGDSEFVPWSQAMLATKSVYTVCHDFPERFRLEDLVKIEEEVRGAAGKIIAVKRATYYGIGMAICRVARAILWDERSVLTVSAWHQGAYRVNEVFAGSPCVVGREGILGMVELDLTEAELSSYRASCDFLKQVYRKITFS